MSTQTATCGGNLRCTHARASSDCNRVERCPDRAVQSVQSDTGAMLQLVLQLHSADMAQVASCYPASTRAVSSVHHSMRTRWLSLQHGQVVQHFTQKYLLLWRPCASLSRMCGKMPRSYVAPPASIAVQWHGLTQWRAAHMLAVARPGRRCARSRSSAQTKRCCSHDSPSQSGGWSAAALCVTCKRKGTECALVRWAVTAHLLSGLRRGLVTSTPFGESGVFGWGWMDACHGKQSAQHVLANLDMGRLIARMHAADAAALSGAKCVRGAHQ